MRRLLLLSVFILTALPLFAQANWPPVLTKSVPFNNRPTDWYRHGTRPDWKCKDPQQTDVFSVMHPLTGDAPNRPLYVVLHSAGHDVFSCMNCTKTVGNHDIYHAPDGFYALYVDCRANQKTDWWWGGRRANEKINDLNRDKSGQDLQPAEKRVLDTVDWVIKKYKIDSNRVYLCGNSMGGSGTLGLGLPHGDVFAAIKANVPAGVEHAADRLGFLSDKIDLSKIPDPPICIDYSAPNDNWSAGHESLFQGMKDRKYNLIAYWGNFGHANDNRVIEKVNDLINTFAWTEIRKDEAYPVFINAACDAMIPWPNREKAVKPGQINAFFRWKNMTDTADLFQMRIFIDKNIKTSVFTVPKETTADLTLRRLQKFSAAPGETVQWTYAGKTGSVQADPNGLIIVAGLKITQKQEILILKKQRQ